MTDKRKQGIGSLLVASIKAKSSDEMKDELFDSKWQALKEHAAHKKRNSAGADARAATFHPMQDKVTALHAKMKLRQGKNPQWKKFIDALEATYPDEIWEGRNVEGWWKSLNGGKPLY